MKSDAGCDKVDDGTRPRGRLTRLTPAVRPGLVEEEASATSPKAVDQSEREKNGVSPDPEVKSRKAVRGRTTADAWRGRLRYYGLALLLVALGVLMRMVLTRLVGPGLSTYITFSPFVMLAALIGGLGPGLLATLAAAAVVSYWLLSPGSSPIERSVDAVGLAFFCVMGILVSIVAELYRRTGDHLDELVSVRTTALSRANEQLQQEVAERRRAEESLRVSEERLTLALRGAGAGAWETDLDTGHNTWDKGMSELLGIPSEPAELESKHWNEYTHPDDRDRVVAAFRAASQDGRPWSADFRVVRADGTIRWVSSRGAVVMFSGNRRKMIGVDQDITKRKEAEAALKESEEKYRLLFDSMIEGFGLHEIISDADGKPCDFRFLQLNEAWERLTGISRAEALGRTMKEILPEIDAYWIETYGRVALTGEPVHYENYNTPLGKWYETYAFSPRKNEFALVFSDVTARKQAEEDLRRSEALLRAVLASSADPIYLKDRDSHLLLANPATFAVVGKPAEAVLGKTDAEFYDDPATGRAIMENDRRIMDSGQMEIVEESVFDPAGTRVYLSTKAPYRDAEGRVVGLVGVAREITDHKRMEEALRSSERRFRALTERSADVVAVFGPEGKITYISPSIQYLFGYCPEEIVGQSLFVFMHPEDGARIQAMIAEGLQDPAQTFTAELRTRHKSGGWRWIAAAGRNLMADSAVGGIVVNFQDITERKQAEETLRQAKTFTDKLLNAPLDTVFVFESATGKPVRWNRRFAEVSGYDDKEIAAMKAPDDFYDDEDLKKAQECTRRTLADGQGVVELSLITKQGMHIPFEYAGTVVQDEAGKTLLLSVGRDITERKRAEEALRELTATLESKVMQRTAELKHRALQLQKLTLEMSEAEDRERKRLAEILHDDLQQIIAAAKFRLSVMRSRIKQDTSLHVLALDIDHLLKEAIEKSRGLSHELSPAVLHHGDFTEALDWLANQTRAKYGLVVHVHASGKADLLSDTITVLLYRTAQELLFNVVKHARVRQAGLRVRRRGRYVCLAISDRGRGFDPRESRETAGFGLLNIRERIELLGGRMKIRSAKGKGSTFFIAVPDTEAGVGRQTSVVREEQEKGPGQRRLPALDDRGPLRVLLADDHKIVREGLRSLLRDEADIEIVGEAAHGREAVDLALRLEPSVVIMDVSMPLIDGDVATRQIKEHRPQTRVIALSTHSEPETIQRMYRAGAEGYVLKTASLEELLTAIRGKKGNGGDV